VLSRIFLEGDFPPSKGLMARQAPRRHGEGYKVDATWRGNEGQLRVEAQSTSRELVHQTTCITIG